jgi:hypothetical protein
MRCEVIAIELLQARAFDPQRMLIVVLRNRVVDRQSYQIFDIGAGNHVVQLLQAHGQTRVPQVHLQCRLGLVQHYRETDCRVECGDVGQIGLDENGSSLSQRRDDALQSTRHVRVQ